jgi:hypothetical protein
MGALSMNKTRDMLGLVCTVLKVMILAAKLVEILMRIAGGATNYRARSLLIKISNPEGLADLCPYGQRPLDWRSNC